MTLKNILLTLSILFAAVSCSMEDDLINEIDNSKSANNGEAYISLNVDAPTSAFTKASTFTDGGEEWHANDSIIKNCSIILLEDNNVVTAIDNADVEDFSGRKIVVYAGTTNIVKFLVKVSKTYKLMVIANSNIKFGGANATTYNTYAKIQAAVQTDLSAFVKIGEKSVTVPSDYQYKSNSTTDAAMLANPYYGEIIKLKQLSARIELAEFNVKTYQAGSTPVDLKITKVELLNVNTQSRTNTEANDLFEKPATNPAKVFDNGGLLVRSATVASDARSEYNFRSEENIANMPLFYSFRNTGKAEGDQVTMKIHFTLSKNGEVLNKVTSKPIIINNGSVLPGYLYRIIVDANAIDNDNIECSIKCYTLDWLPNAFEIEMIEQ